MYSMNDLSKRRAVVYQVLKEMMPEQLCMQALWILEDKYATLTVIPILEYVDFIDQDVLDLGTNKLYLNHELTKTLYGRGTVDYADPLEKMRTFKLQRDDAIDLDERINKELGRNGH